MIYRRIAVSYAAFFAVAGILNYLNGSDVAISYARILAVLAALTVVLVLIPFRVAKVITLLWLYAINVATQAVSPVGEWEGAMFALTVVGAMFYEGWFKRHTWIRFAAIAVPILAATLLSIATTFLVAPAWTEPDLFLSLLGTTLIVTFFVQAGMLIIPLVRLARKAGMYEGQNALYRAGIDGVRSSDYSVYAELERDVDNANRVLEGSRERPANFR